MQHSIQSFIYSNRVSGRRIYYWAVSIKEPRYQQEYYLFLLDSSQYIHISGVLHLTDISGVED